MSGSTSFNMAPRRGFVEIGLLPAAAGTSTRPRANESATRNDFHRRQLGKTVVTSSRPRVLQTAINGIPELVTSVKWSRQPTERAMRPERQETMKKWLIHMLFYNCSLEHGGSIGKINGKWFQPITVKEMAADTKLSYQQVERCLADLRNLGFIESKQIRRKNPVNGKLEVSPGLRSFTRKFWEALGLWDEYQSAVEWAKKHSRHTFDIHYKPVKAKGAKTPVKPAGPIATRVMKNMANQVETDRRKEETRRLDEWHEYQKAHASEHQEARFNGDARWVPKATAHSRLSGMYA